MYQYHKVGLGGTFDHFHKGHQVFLLQAAQLAEELVIGITTKNMLSQKQFFHQLESFETRHQSVNNFCNNLSNKVSLVPLTDPFGPTLEHSSIEALAATTDTRVGAENINRKRTELKLPSLPLHVFDLQQATDNLPISSERIRAGRINRAGFVYFSVLENSLILTEKQRAFFSKPQGQIVDKPSPSHLTFVVGDKSLQSFQENQWHYDLGIYDHKTKRKPVEKKIHQSAISVINEAGTITSQLSKALLEAIEKKQQHLFVEGEEDLSAVALLLLAPLGTHIYYGQPNQGIVEMIVTEALKEQCVSILRS